MSYELFISLRHLRHRKSQKFISLITWISIGGVAVGVMALIIVIAVMSGFGKDLREFTFKYIVPFKNIGNLDKKIKELDNINNVLIYH